MTERPYSQACENNKTPILAVLKQHCQAPGTLLEIGAGTGQHAAWLSGQLPHLQWQPSDVTANLPYIQQWQSDPCNRALPPLALDVAGEWPTGHFDYLFTANTFHIMAEPLVESCIRKGCEHLTEGGKFLVYGPFNYQGQFTSDSNRQFDQRLREGDGDRGIRDQEWVVEQFARQQRHLLADHEMPANNRLLVFG
ncbi:MAG: DUF938 domain-containing protein [Pseudomonadota bacterium]|uniref:DUF938 domain-containing protein n=1 Tax=Alcanivorax sp. NBRC 102024 TaxID=1113895 RepID=UPI000789FD73|nr:DUF938 domain-containing protein [Alcanivorax sp. NBRC 102024]MEE2603945.1 DUF938 domain-containing protein [Pseudomonadota bacterium]